MFMALISPLPRRSPDHALGRWCHCAVQFLKVCFVPFGHPMAKGLLVACFGRVKRTLPILPTPVHRSAGNVQIVAELEVYIRRYRCFSATLSACWRQGNQGKV